MKKILAALTALFLFSEPALAQMTLAGSAIDNMGNLYCAGSFDTLVGFGKKTVLTTTGKSDVFIAKYDVAGNLKWASRYGGAESEHANAMTCDAAGNTYLTGNFTGATKFKHFRASAAPHKTSATFFVVKLNVSGDPVWLKSSNNPGRDDGFAVTTDPSGNTYVAGTFENSMQIDGISVSSVGKSDLFVLKINASGALAWLKNYGDNLEGGCNTILFANDKLYIGTSDETKDGYCGRIYCIKAGSGEFTWRKEFGGRKGSIECLALDNLSSLLITGFVENKESDEHRKLLVAKYSLEGEEKWSRIFNGGFPVGNAIMTDQANNIFVTGAFCDTIRMDKQSAGGYSKDDIFIASFSNNGQVKSLMSAGNAKYDKGRCLHRNKNTMLLTGEFTNGVEFGKYKLQGPDNTIFMAGFDAASSNCVLLLPMVTKVLEEETARRTVDVYGKLLVGKSSAMEFLVGQALSLEDDNGAVLNKTQTDEKGDFSFKNVDANTNVNVVLEKNDNLKETDEVYLATQTGIVIDKLVMKDKKFKYRIISPDLVKLQEMPEEDVDLKLIEFIKTAAKEVSITERISYEANSWVIPAESVPQLTKMAQHMKKNLRLRLEINAHTDALGDADYNKKLSAMRGEEVKEFLVQNKISGSRITVIGHGEEKVINRCAEAVNCSESEHAYNRRVEFRFYIASGL